MKRDQALRQAEKMISEGADIIDIGGESTRPGHTPVSAEMEIDRVMPVIELLKKEFDIPLSLDTYKAEVAQVGVEAGIDLINDIWGLRYDSKMAEVIARAEVVCCLMHNRAKAEYQNFLSEVIADIRESLAVAENAGISKEKIILDPGIGFGKSYQQNLEMLRHLSVLQEFQLPVLLGTSNKSVIGLTLNLPPEERLEGTLATTCWAVQQGCAFVRVHAVKENVRAIKMMRAIEQA